MDAMGMMEDWMAAMAAEQAACCAAGTVDDCDDIVPSRYLNLEPVGLQGICADSEGLSRGPSRYAAWPAIVEIGGHRFVWGPRPFHVPAKDELPQRVAAGLRPGRARRGHRSRRRQGRAADRRYRGDPESWDDAGAPNGIRLRSPAVESEK